MNRFSVIVGFLILAAVGRAAEAQQGTAALRGRAVDEQNAALPGVTVVIIHVDTGISRETMAGPDGTYAVSNLIAGALSGHCATRRLRQAQSRRRCSGGSDDVDDRSPAEGGLAQ